MRTYVLRLRDRMASEDAGMTLTELIVGMLIMVIFMTIFTGAVVSMAKTVNKVEAVTTSSAQINTAFLKLDKLVRYATAVTTANTGSSGDWYVELDSVNNDTSIETCTQLRVDIASKQLQQRTWTVPSSNTTTYAGLSSWVPMANNISNGAAASGSADQPFSAPNALVTAATHFQRLTITLKAAGAGADVTPTRSNMTFTALNSTTTPTTTIVPCQQVSRP